MQFKFILLRVAYSLSMFKLVLSWPVGPAPEISGGQHLCGRGLADALALVCHGRGFRTAESQEAHHKRGVEMKRSVVDECCIHACSYSQLESYCAPGPAKPAGLSSLLQSMKNQKGGGGGRQQAPVAPVASPTTTTTVQPLHDLEVAAGDRQQSGELLGGGSSSRNRGNKPDSPYFGNRPFFFVTPARANPAYVAARKKKH